jgi:hypothetical protein
VESGLSSRAPSGLFPAGSSRPSYREAHPVRVGAVLAGAGVTAGWLLLFGLLASSARGYVWLTLLATAIAWLTALALLRAGDRGVATGIGLASAFGLAVATVVVIVRWATIGWPLW